MTVLTLIAQAVDDLNSQLYQDFKVHIDIGFNPVPQKDSGLHSVARKSAKKRRSDFRKGLISSSSSRKRLLERYRPLRFRFGTDSDFVPATSWNTVIPVSRLLSSDPPVVSSSKFEVCDRFSFKLKFDLAQPADSVWKPVMFQWIDSQSVEVPWEAYLYFDDNIQRPEDWTIVLDETENHMVIHPLGLGNLVLT